MTNNIELDPLELRRFDDLGGKGPAAGKPSSSEFICGFSLDSASYQLLKDLSEGTHLANAAFTGRKTGGGETPSTWWSRFPTASL